MEHKSYFFQEDPIACKKPKLPDSDLENCKNNELPESYEAKCWMKCFRDASDHQFVSLNSDDPYCMEPEKGIIL